MISGKSLFLYDKRFQTGPGTASFYKKHAERLLRGLSRATLPAGPADPVLVRAVEACVGKSAETFDGDSVVATCLRRGELMVSALLRSLPQTPGL